MRQAAGDGGERRCAALRPRGARPSRGSGRLRCACALRVGNRRQTEATGMADDSKPTSAPDQTQQQQQQIQIQIDAQQGTGVYSNLMMISHRKEEFILDFLFLQPQRAPQGQAVATLRSRVITSPEHAKRILRALQENLRRYEESFGIIDESTDMPKVMH